MRTLVIGDIHEPVSHPKYLKFCKDMYDEYECNKVVLIGDVVDLHAVSFHAHHPDCPGPSDEYMLALSRIQRWYKAFPRAVVCIGNHDNRPLRLAESVSIPSKFMRNHAEIWHTPRWKWVTDVIIDGVYYFHGTGCSGLNPAFNQAKARLMPVVMGHTHSKAGIKWLCGPQTRIFGLDVGCGIDVDAWQFAYGKNYINKPILGCGVVLKGIPYHEIMPMSQGERYHK